MVRLLLPPDNLPLTQTQRAMLAQREREALSRCGRMDFSGGILPRLCEAFAESPCIQSDELAQTLAGLTELFYAFKNLTHDALSDEELLGAMVRLFDGPAQGSLTALSDVSERTLERAVRDPAYRGGLSDDDALPDGMETEEDDALF
ncbi:MAG: DUF6323 family protein [Clostridiales bacterium]|nr:DUF6323 family protein [Clostridiales bacterium]MDY5515085.1 DUF6323 family protein [Candidatus Ventricola sp.]